MAIDDLTAMRDERDLLAVLARRLARELRAAQHGEVDRRGRAAARSNSVSSAATTTTRARRPRGASSQVDHLPLLRLRQADLRPGGVCQRAPRPATWRARRAAGAARGRAAPPSCARPTAGTRCRRPGGGARPASRQSTRRTAPNTRHPTRQAAAHRPHQPSWVGRRAHQGPPDGQRARGLVACASGALIVPPRRRAARRCAGARCAPAGCSAPLRPSVAADAG